MLLASSCLFVDIFVTADQTEMICKFYLHPFKGRKKSVVQVKETAGTPQMRSDDDLASSISLYLWDSSDVLISFIMSNNHINSSMRLLLFRNIYQY